MSGCVKNEPGTSIDDELESLLIKNGGSLSSFILPESHHLSAIPQDPNNPISSEKVALGRLLFHETGIALDSKRPEGLSTYSCASCHHASAGFQACMPQGIGDGGIGFSIIGNMRDYNPDYANDELDVQPLRTPATLNTAFQTNMLWNGMFGATGANTGTETAWTMGTPKEKNYLGYEGVETQAIAGLGVHRLLIDESFIGSNITYKSMFAEAFPELPEEERINSETGGLAIAAYERTILANEAPFQGWLRGNLDAMTESQKIGAILFFGKGNCSSCHNGPALNSMEFHALGMKDFPQVYGNEIVAPMEDPAYRGRGSFTQNSQDDYKFKVPQLYNLKETPFYGHGASFTSIKDVIRYKNEAQAENPNVPESQLSSEFKPLYLSEREIEYIADFIENALHDNNLKRYEPSELPSGLCFPSNDELSQQELGCN